MYCSVYNGRVHCGQELAALEVHVWDGHFTKEELPTELEVTSYTDPVLGRSFFLPMLILQMNKKYPCNNVFAVPVSNSKKRRRMIYEIKMRMRVLFSAAIDAARLSGRTREVQRARDGQRRQEDVCLRHRQPQRQTDQRQRRGLRERERSL